MAVPSRRARASTASTHPDLDFCVDVTVYERDGRFMATADLAEDSRDIGVGHTPREAVRASLAVLGEPYASEMAFWLARAVCQFAEGRHWAHPFPPP